MRRTAAVVALLVIAVLMQRSSAVPPADSVPKYDSGGILVASAISDVGGAVGIGTTSPLGTVDVKFAPDHHLVMRGNGSFSQLMGLNDADTAYTHLRVDGDPLLLNGNSEGSVGVGTLYPLGKFDVRMGTNQNVVMRTDGASHSQIMSSNDAYTAYEMLKVDAQPLILNFNSEANVGIGTTAPSTKLHVVGDVTVTGNIAAKYQDVAEWVDARAKPRQGP